MINEPFVHRCKVTVSVRVWSLGWFTRVLSVITWRVVESPPGKRRPGCVKAVVRCLVYVSCNRGL